MDPLDQRSARRSGGCGVGVVGGVIRTARRVRWALTDSAKRERVYKSI